MTCVGFTASEADLVFSTSSFDLEGAHKTRAGQEQHNISTYIPVFWLCFTSHQIDVSSSIVTSGACLDRPSSIGPSTIIIIVFHIIAPPFIPWCPHSSSLPLTLHHFLCSSVPYVVLSPSSCIPSLTSMTTLHGVSLLVRESGWRVAHLCHVACA